MIGSMEEELEDFIMYIFKYIKTGEVPNVFLQILPELIKSYSMIKSPA